MSPVEFKERPMSCHKYFFPCRKASCRMSILRNGHVALSILRVNAPKARETTSAQCPGMRPVALLVLNIILLTSLIDVALNNDTTTEQCPCFSHDDEEDTWFFVYRPSKGCKQWTGSASILYFLIYFKIYTLATNPILKKCERFSGTLR